MKVTLNIIFFLLLGGIVFSQPYIQSNIGSYTSPTFKNDALLNTGFVLRDYGFITDFTVMYSPIESIGLSLTQRLKSRSRSIGGSIGYYHYYENGFGIEGYLGIDAERNRRTTYNLRHSLYYFQFGISKSKRKFKQSLYGRCNILDYTRLDIKLIDERVQRVQEIINNDPKIYPEICYKVSYGNKNVTGFAMFTKPLIGRNYLIYNNIKLAMGAEINMRLFSNYLNKMINKE